MEDFGFGVRKSLGHCKQNLTDHFSGCLKYKDAEEKCVQWRPSLGGFEGSKDAVRTGLRPFWGTQ